MVLFHSSVGQTRTQPFWMREFIFVKKLTFLRHRYTRTEGAPSLMGGGGCGSILPATKFDRSGGVLTGGVLTGGVLL